MYILYIAQLATGSVYIVVYCTQMATDSVFIIEHCTPIVTDSVYIVVYCTQLATNSVYIVVYCTSLTDWITLYFRMLIGTERKIIMVTREWFLLHMFRNGKKFLFMLCRKLYMFHIIVIDLLINHPFVRESLMRLYSCARFNNEAISMWKVNFIHIIWCWIVN